MKVQEFLIPITNTGLLSLLKCHSVDLFWFGFLWLLLKKKNLDDLYQNVFLSDRDTLQVDLWRFYHLF